MPACQSHPSCTFARRCLISRFNEMVLKFLELIYLGTWRIKIMLRLKWARWNELLINSDKIDAKKWEKSQRHGVFPGGHPSKYYLRPSMLNFNGQMSIGVFIEVWALTKDQCLRALLKSYFSMRKKFSSPWVILFTI